MVGAKLDSVLPEDPAMPVQLAHFSDVHTLVGHWPGRPRRWFSKELTGYVNLHLLGRARRFKLSNTLTQTLIRQLPALAPDGWLFSGDASMIGLPCELQQAAKLLSVTTAPPAMAVPGNHDVYTRRSSQQQHFEQAFAPWQLGERLPGHHYPFARSFGPVTVIALQTATPNRNPIDASGEIGADQAARLRELCAKLPPGPRWVLTHYPIVTKDDTIEPHLHRLRDTVRARDIIRDCGIHAWLHGHIHRGYIAPPTAEWPCWKWNPGSLTQTDRWSFHRMILDEKAVELQVWRYDHRTQEFHPQPEQTQQIPWYVE
ncbi:MAG: metallophosphoesterase family protein [Gemmataceae bacterium]